MPFLDGALHVEPWKGLVFGVFKDSHAGYRVPDVNFHGLTLPVRLPQIDTVEGGVWSARADIDSCPDLELVLPARKEAVETPFLEEMREAARLAVYRAMAQADPAPRVAWTDWHKAKEAGIEMPEPPAELRPWRPAIADTDYWDERSAFTAVGSDALVMQADPEPPEAQALHRALGLTGLQGGSNPRSGCSPPSRVSRVIPGTTRSRASPASRPLLPWMAPFVRWITSPMGRTAASRNGPRPS